MKILYYSPHPHLILNNPSGYGTHMREMIKAFEQAGHTVMPVIMGGITATASTDLPKSGLLKSILKKTLPVILWESFKDFQLLRFDLKAAAALETAIKAFAPDLIYERGNYMQGSGGLMAKKHGIKNILEINAPYVDERRKYQGESFWLKVAQKNEKHRADAADRIVVVSSPLKNYLVTQQGINENKILVTPNAIDPQKLFVNESKKDAAAIKYGLKEKFVIGFVGSIAIWHGVDILIHAFNQVKPHIPNALLFIVGGGETMDDLQKLTRELGISNNVVFTGNVKHEDVFTFISLMDLTVLPRTSWYMSPIKIFEYGAMGKAIVAPDNAPVKDVMVHETDGVLIEPNAEAIGKAILRLYNDADLRNRVSTQFQQKVCNIYTWENTAKRILEGFL